MKCGQVFSEPKRSWVSSEIDKAVGLGDETEIVDRQIVGLPRNRVESDEAVPVVRGTVNPSIAKNIDFVISRVKRDYIIAETTRNITGDIDPLSLCNSGCQTE